MRESCLMMSVVTHDIDLNPVEFNKGKGGVDCRSM